MSNIVSVSPNILLKCVSSVEPNISVCRDSELFIDKTHFYMYNQMISCKQKIGEVSYSKHWEKMKKRTNPYELIHTTHSNKNMSVADYIPLSRSYFKLWEMLKKYELIGDINSIITAHLAEGPGGFMEATRYYRRNRIDYMYGITLRSTSGEVPGWSSSKRFLKRNRNVQISYGSDGTGNLYNINNIISFRDVVGKGNVDFITADGGFDFSVDFDNQEYLFYRLLLCEITTALSIQKLGGTFVCKIFDIFHKFTYEMIYILYNLYDSIIIEKPVTSRPANSEKYIIARGFRGISNVYLKKLHDIVLHWNNNITGILEEPVSKMFLEKLTDFNLQFNFYQMKNIKLTLTLIKNRHTTEELDEIRKQQCHNAVNWCNRYKQKINRNCFVLKKYYNWRLLPKKNIIKK